MPDQPPPDKPLAHWWRFRFSVSGLLVFTFGLAVGLAYSRVKGTSAPDYLFAVFAGWFVVGMAQTSWVAFRRWRSAELGLSRSERFALALDVSWPLATIGMVALAATMDVLKREQRLNNSTNDLSFWTLHGLIQGTFFLAVICGYSGPRGWIDGRQVQRNRMSMLYSLLAIGMSFFWLSCLVHRQFSIPSLVHVAIHGVQLNWPTRWLGRDFAPASIFPELQQQFIDRAMLAATLSALALGLICGIVTCCAHRRIFCACLLLAWLACLGINLWLIYWCFTLALPTLSPFMTPQILTHSTATYGLGLSLILAAAGMFSWRWTATKEVGTEALRAPCETFIPLHQQPFIMLTFLSATVWSNFEPLRMNFSLPDLNDLQAWLQLLMSIVEFYCVWQPELLLQVAAMLLVARRLWPVGRAKKEIAMPTFAIQPAVFCLSMALTTITIIVAVPTLAWYGFALFLWSGMP